MTRRYARELALQTLFSIELGRHEIAEALSETFARPDVDEQRAFVKELVFGTVEHAVEADATISPLLQGWTIERLPTIDRLVLRLAYYEMRFHTDTPHAVIINEAVELAKKFSTEDSAGFVNGVLSRAAAG